MICRVSTVINKVWIKQISVCWGGQWNKTESLVMLPEGLSVCYMRKYYMMVIMTFNWNFFFRDVICKGSNAQNTTIEIEAHRECKNRRQIGLRIFWHKLFLVNEECKPSVYLLDTGAAAHRRCWHLHLMCCPSGSRYPLLKAGNKMEKCIWMEMALCWFVNYKCIPLKNNLKV